MCGICGTVGLSDRTTIEKMTSVVAHRGPDDGDVKLFESDRVALGHRRLSILDLSALGHQPMTDSEDRFWITYNGEIYNYQDVRSLLAAKGYRFKSNCDTEVLVYAYKEWGTECLQKLNGMFAFAIWDTQSRSLFAARDRFGIKPLYYWHHKDKLVFGSEIKSIFKSGMVQPEIDYEALHTPAMYQIAPRTGFKNIHKLLPGQYLLFQGDKLEVSKYWELKPSCDVSNVDAAADELDALLQDTVKMQMVSDVPIGLFLSGGLDSSLLLALMTKARSEPVDTFTIKFRNADQKYEQMPRDSSFARVVAEAFNSRHKEIEIEPDIVQLLPKIMWHMDEPLADPAAINTYLLCRTAREHGITVILNGMGADEIFGGYRNYRACLLASDYQRLVPQYGQRLVKRIVNELPVATASRGLLGVRWAKRFVSFASLPESERFLASTTMPPSEFVHLFQKGVTLQDTHFARVQRRTLEQSGLPYLVRMCLTDTSFYMADHNLLYSDKASMAASVEMRPPFTDHRVGELMFSTYPALRIKGQSQKMLLRRIARRHLPQNIVDRPKAPFGAPLRSWIRGPLAEMVSDYLSPAALKMRGIYNPDFVWMKIDKDRKGIEDNAHLIWKLLCNEIWFRTFFEKAL